VPISPAGCEPLLEPYFAYKNEWFIGERQAQKLVKKVANRAKVSREVTPHVLRHTFATLALQNGISLAAVKEILGHDRLSTTAILPQPHRQSRSK
jgi:integrase/recombinase XerD